jgi:hypothetical protein
MNELVLDLGSEGVRERARGPAWFLVNHFAGLESSCENPDGDDARGKAVVDVALVDEGSYGLRELGCEGLRRERMAKEGRS